MKTTLNLLGLSLLLLVLRCSLDTIADYGAFNVTITNKGTTTITDIELFMIGAEETMTIKELDPGQSTGSQTFILPKKEGEIPISRGDYWVYFTQRDTVKDIGILNHEHGFRTEMWIEINDHTYVTRFPLATLED
jgi:hypothetical protein